MEATEADYKWAQNIKDQVARADSEEKRQALANKFGIPLPPQEENPHAELVQAMRDRLEEVMPSFEEPKPETKRGTEKQIKEQLRHKLRLLVDEYGLAQGDIAKAVGCKLNRVQAACSRTGTIAYDLLNQIYDAASELASKRKDQLDKAWSKAKNTEIVVKPEPHTDQVSEDLKRQLNQLQADIMHLTGRADKSNQWMHDQGQQADERYATHSIEIRKLRDRIGALEDAQDHEQDHIDVDASGLVVVLGASYAEMLDEYIEAERKESRIEYTHAEMIESIIEEVHTRRFFTDQDRRDDLMPFGIHQGVPFKDLPPSYLRWLKYVKKWQFKSPYKEYFDEACKLKKIGLYNG